MSKNGDLKKRIRELAVAVVKNNLVLAEDCIKRGQYFKARRYLKRAERDNADMFYVMHQRDTIGLNRRIFRLQGVMSDHECAQHEREMLRSR